MINPSVSVDVSAGIAWLMSLKQRWDHSLSPFPPVTSAFPSSFLSKVTFINILLTFFFWGGGDCFLERNYRWAGSGWIPDHLELISDDFVKTITLRKVHEWMNKWMNDVYITGPQLTAALGARMSITKQCGCWVVPDFMTFFAAEFKLISTVVKWLS